MRLSWTATLGPTDAHATGASSLPDLRGGRVGRWHPSTPMPICRNRARFRRSVSTASCPTARRRLSSPPAAMSSGCACRGWTRRACSARSSTGTPAASTSARPTCGCPSSMRYLPGTMVLETSWGTPTGWFIVRDVLLIGPVAPRDRDFPHAPARPHRLRRRPRAAADRALRERRGAAHHGLRPDLRLRPQARAVVLHRPRLPPGQGHRARESTSSSRSRRTCGSGFEGSRAIARTLLKEGDNRFVALSWSEHAPAVHVRGGLRPAGLDRPPLAALARPGPVPRPPVAHPPAAQRAHAQGPDLRARPVRWSPRRPRRCRRRRTASATGTTATAGSATRRWPCGASTPSASTGRPTTSSGSSPTSRRKSDELQIMYGVDEESDLSEEVLDHLEGYDGARPVRIGNGAFTQKQHDVWGSVLDSVYIHWQSRDRLDEQIWPMLKRLVERALSNWREPDRGIWEVRGRTEALHLVQGHVLGGAGPRRAAGPHPRGVPACRQVAGGRRRDPHDVCTHAVDERGVFTQHYDTNALDASILLIPLVHFLPFDDPRLRCDGAGDRRRAHGRRARPALQGGPDRRRLRRRGGRLHDLLVLAGHGAVADRGAQAGEGAVREAALLRQLAQPVRRGDRPAQRPASGQLSRRRSPTSG